ncbi:MAG: substrate-binding domain-containing protein [Nakamurella sp.]
MTSRHASDGGRRGLAPWIIITLVTLVLVAAATVAYVFIVRGDDQDSATAQCSSQVTLPIAAAPGATDVITAAANAFDATGPVARSACVTTSVTAIQEATADLSLLEQWKQDTAKAPAMWVADSEADLVTVEANVSALTAGRDTEAIATSPVVLAVRSADAAAAAALSWQDLPAQTGPDGSVMLPSDQHVILALPNPTTNRATSYALQSVLAAGSAPAADDVTEAAGTNAPGGTGAPVDIATVTSSADALRQLGAGGPTVQPQTTKEALTQLAAGNAAFTAVPVVESDLVTFTASTPGLTPVSPQGAAVGDAIWPVSLTADWVTPTLSSAAAQFAAFLRSPAGAAVFQQNGLQPAGSVPTGGVAPSTSGSATGSAAVPAPIALPDAGAGVADALATAIGATPAG